jgi:Nucleotidyl transferase AbiEii toxin, Type IV TA system
MSFQFAHHKKILTVLESLNADVLRESFAYFGGGTLIALDFEEYRWSKDIDFICPVASQGYKHLRNVVFDGGFQALFQDLSQIQIGRGTTDQYGIRMSVAVEDVPIKVEIIAEARLILDPPRYPEWSPVACLSLSDCFASKLLANADRFMDDGVESRDLIDLAMLRLQTPIPQAALDKAENAYEVLRPLEKAVQRFQARPDYREACFAGLQIVVQSQVSRIMDGIDLLAGDLNLPTTSRTFNEQHDFLADLENDKD